MGPAKSQPLQLDCILVPKTLNFLQGDIKQMDQCVTQMLKYVEVHEDELSMKASFNDGGDTQGKNVVPFEQKRLEVVTDIKDLHQAFTSLVQHYVSLTGQLRNMAPDLLDVAIDQESSSPTQAQKLGMLSAGPQADSLNTFLSSGDGSSDLSFTTGSDTLSSFSSPSSDSGSKSNTLSTKRYLAHVNQDNGELHENIVESQTLAGMNGKHLLAGEMDVVGMLKENEHSSYDELLDEVVSVLECQRNNAVLIEELERTRKKLQSSEEEMAELEDKFRNETSELTRKLQCELDLVNQKAILLEAELSSEKRLTSELQEWIVKYTNDLTNRDCEVEKLQAALSDLQQNFTKERVQLLSDVSDLSQQQDLLQGRLEEAESRTRLVQDQLKQCQLESMDLKTSHEAREKNLLGEIEELKAELARRCETIGALNHTLDASKNKYDMLMVEKDETVAKLHTLTAELRSLFIQIKQMEAYFKQVTEEHVELLTASESAQKLVDELRLRVMELEKELGQQRTVISEREEEKREAIRQLCLSLEHYRCGYHELRQAFVGHRHGAAGAPHALKRSIVA